MRICTKIFINVSKLIVTHQTRLNQLIMLENQQFCLHTFTDLYRERGGSVAEEPAFIVERVHLENHLLNFESIFSCCVGE